MTISADALIERLLRVWVLGIALELFLGLLFGSPRPADNIRKSARSSYVSREWAECIRINFLPAICSLCLGLDVDQMIFKRVPPYSLADLDRQTKQPR